MKFLKSFLIHPLFIYGIIFLLECIPTDNADVFYEFPNEGENFKTLENDNVYYFTNNTKLKYNSEKCYFGQGNPPYSASYKEGGIKTIDIKIGNKIPLVGNVCDEEVITNVTIKPLTFTEKYLKVSYFLGNFSDFAHFFVYLVLALSIIFHFRENKNKYWFALVACFTGGALLEGVQHFLINGRTASYDDQILNTIGAIVGIICYYYLKKYKKIA